MEISIRTRGVERTDNLNQVLQRSIEFAVDRHRSHNRPDFGLSGGRKRSSGRRRQNVAG